MFTWGKATSLTTILFFAVSSILIADSFHENESPGTSLEDATQYFLNLLQENDPSLTARSLKRIKENWEEGYEIMLLEAIYYSRSNKHSSKLLKVLEDQTGKDFGLEHDRWFQWIWNKEATYT